MALRSPREFTEVLAANGEREFNGGGQAVTILSATGGFELSMGDGAFTNARAGITYPLPANETFNKINIRDTSAAINTVVLVVSFAEIKDNRISGSITVAQAPDAQNAAVTVGTSAVVLDAADTSRRALTIQNLGAADIYVGKTGVTTANGIKVGSGKTYVLTWTTAAIYGISGTAGQDVRVLAEAG